MISPATIHLPETAHEYPQEHWKVLQRFLIGEEYDPKEQFPLAADVWDAAAYATNGRIVPPHEYRFRFGHLRSFLKPYVKWYCYQRLIGRGKSLTTAAAAFPYALTHVDTYLVEHGYTSLDSIASQNVFAMLWQAYLAPHTREKDHLCTEAEIMPQRRTRTFWLHLRTHFGAPHFVPPIAPHSKRRPVEFAADKRQLIPLPVIRQLVNKLALHREGKERLNPYHHLRLCTLILALCLGRRINEVLAAPRGTGPLGPLTRYPARDGSTLGALWFQFAPNKNGPGDQVYISPEWEEVVHYCVHALLCYSDEVRTYAQPGEQELLILVSGWNQTATPRAVRAPVSIEAKPANQTGRKVQAKPCAKALHADGLRHWLGDRWYGTTFSPGILRRWNITENGQPDGNIYPLRTHQMRHTRQSALALDPTISFISRQRDLNHPRREMQFAYQHVLAEQHAQLQAKAREGHLVGPALPWISTLLGTTTSESGESPQFHQGQPALLSPRWRALIAGHPQFLQFNRVPCGYCTLPQGPQGCEEYMNCLEAADGGCQWFLTETEDEQMLIQITQRAEHHRKSQQESALAGRVVQAEKHEILARRAEMLQGEVLQHASQDLRARLHQRLREIKEEQP